MHIISIPEYIVQNNRLLLLLPRLWAEVNFERSVSMITEVKQAPLPKRFYSNTICLRRNWLVNRRV